MKIAFLTPEFPHQAIKSSSGGIGTSIFNLSKGLIALGHKVSVLVYNQSKDEIIDDESMTIYKIKNVKLKALSWWLTRKKIEKLINRLYDNKKIDILEAPDWTGITSFIDSRCPTIIKLHGSDTYFCHLENRPVKWINKFHEKKALKNADAHVSVSQFTADITNKIFKQKNHYTIIPNGISLESFQSQKSKEKTNNTLLYFGTIIRKKGVLELAHIFNEVLKIKSDVNLILTGKDNFDIRTGNNSTYELMKRILSDKALKQHEYLGQVAYADIKEILSKADVVVLPSFAEALPVSWLESMAMQKIIVASNIGWAKEIIIHGHNGFMVNPKDHSAFAKIILDILDAKYDNKTIEKNARKTILSDFSNEYIANKNLLFYKEVIDEYCSKQQ